MRLAAVLTIAVLAGLAAVTPATAAKREVPRGFFGANWNFEVVKSSPSTQDSTWGRMAESGVEAQRLTFFWSHAQPNPGDPTDFSETDAKVTLAVSHGIELLPVIAFGPRWARESDAPHSPPSGVGYSAYASYLNDLVGRYGPSGSFWPAHPELPYRPIRVWQIWNEPAAAYQWDVSPGEDWAKSYGKLLRYSYYAIKDADAEAKVVLAGLANRSDRDLDYLYKAGKIHGYFDVAALHPYTVQPGGVVTLIKRFRKVLKKHGDNNKQVWLTEFGLPAGKGKSGIKSTLQTDDAGMARFLRRSYGEMIANRQWHSLRVTHMYWFTWASRYSRGGRGWIFDWSGLLRYRKKSGQDVFSTKPALGECRKLARSAEGCAKTSTGACA